MARQDRPAEEASSDASDVRDLSDETSGDARSAEPAGEEIVEAPRAEAPPVDAPRADSDRSTAPADQPADAQVPEMASNVRMPPASLQR